MMLTYNYNRDVRLPNDLREANALNGLIVADADDVNPEEFVGVHELASEQVKSLVIKRRKAIQRRNHYLKAKRIAERNFLKKKTVSMHEEYSRIVLTLEVSLKSLLLTEILVQMHGVGLVCSPLMEMLEWGKK